MQMLLNVACIFIAHSLVSLDKKSRNNKLKARRTCRAVLIMKKSITESKLHIF